MRKTSMCLVLAFVCAAHLALAADDGQTQPKINTNGTNSPSTPVDIIATTNGAGNFKGVNCQLLADGSGILSGARVKFTINGGAVQTVDFTSFEAAHTDAGTLIGYTGWVPMNLRFTSSIRVQVQKSGAGGGGVYCTVSWALD